MAERDILSLQEMDPENSGAPGVVTDSCSSCGIVSCF
jgi:hypothetical protein